MRLFRLLALIMPLVLAPPAMADFTGPVSSGVASTAAGIETARLGSYVTLDGHIVSRQRDDYFVFRDASGEVRVEIEPDVWRGQTVGPQDTVRLLGEVDTGSGGRYVWVDTLQVLTQAAAD